MFQVCFESPSAANTKIATTRTPTATIDAM
jgi:hypothetical protein